MIRKKMIDINSGRRDEDIIDYQKMSNPTQEDLKISLQPTLSVGNPVLEKGSALKKQSAMRLSSADPKQMRSSVRRQVISSKTKKQQMISHKKLSHQIIISKFIKQTTLFQAEIFVRKQTNYTQIKISRSNEPIKMGNCTDIRNRKPPANSRGQSN